jgi:hypothetical protein
LFLEIRVQWSDFRWIFSSKDAPRLDPIWPSITYILGNDEAADWVMFSCVGRTIALASQHGKEGVLARTHPVVPFLAIGREWLHFVDRRHQLTISEHRISRRTNDSSFKAAKPEAALGWLETDRRAHCNPTRMASIRRPSLQQLLAADPGQCPYCNP